MIRPSILLIATLSSLALPACRDGTSPTTRVLEIVAARTTLNVGDTLQLVALVNGGSIATPPGIEWSTNDTAIAFVSETGLLTAKRGGMITVSATSGDLSDQEPLTIAEPPKEEFTGVVSNSEFFACAENEAWFLGYGGVYDEVKNAYRAGLRDVFIRVRGRVVSGGPFGSQYTKTMEVMEVHEVREASASECPRGPLTIRPMHNPQVLVNRTLQFTANRGGVAWTSSDPLIAEVNATGLVTARRAGTVSILARSEALTTSSTLRVHNPWTMPGFARTTTIVRNEDGSPNAFTTGHAYCIGADNSTMTRVGTSARFTGIHGTPQGREAMLSTSRLAACRIAAYYDPNGLGATHAGITFAAMHFALPGETAVEQSVDVVLRPGVVNIEAADFMLQRGDTARVPVTTNEAVTYRSLIPEVATVDQSGLIRVVGPGATWIIPSVAQDSTKMTLVQVRVSPDGWQ